MRIQDFERDVLDTSRKYDNSSKLRMPTLYAYRNVNYTLAAQIARPFTIWKHPFPCFPSESDWFTISRQKTPTKRGFLYFKARKAASSTMAGIALRIAKSKATHIHLPSITPNATFCLTRFNHPAASLLQYNKRDRQHSFLWSMIREPTKRDVSEFFHFGVSRNNLKPTRRMFQWYHDTTLYMWEYYLQFMSTDLIFSDWQNEQYERRTNKTWSNNMQHNKNPNINIFDDNLYIPTVQKIITDYDFIGITERLDESLVTLQLLLNLSTVDILHLNSKQNGGWDDGLFRNTCFYIHPPNVSYDLQYYLNHAQDWQNKKRGSNLLYVTVNESLDRTIASLDPQLFQQALHQYQWAMKHVKRKCASTPIRYPCSESGVRQEQHDCLLWDLGCGNDCLDQAAQELGL